MMVDASAKAPDKYARPKKHVPLTFKILDNATGLIGFLLLAWVFSVVIEWLGMFFIWSDQGAAHSQAMLRRELGYLGADFDNSIISESPAALAFDAALLVKHTLFESSHIIDFFEWLKTPDVGASSMRISIAKVAILFNEYFQAFINTTLVFVVRLMVATLSLPGFLFIGAAAFIDGLVQRELRIYGGGVERGRIYHLAKPWIKPAVLTTWFFYLGIPFSVHPNLVFVPAMAVFGLAIYISAALYKKSV